MSADSSCGRSGPLRPPTYPPWIRPARIRRLHPSRALLPLLPFPCHPLFQLPCLRPLRPLSSALAWKLSVRRRIGDFGNLAARPPSPCLLPSPVPRCLLGTPPCPSLSGGHPVDVASLRLSPPPTVCAPPFVRLPVFARAFLSALALILSPGFWVLALFDGLSLSGAPMSAWVSCHGFCSLLLWAPRIVLIL